MQILHRELITLLAKSPWLTMKELIQQITLDMSQASCYRIVGELIDQHVLVKHDKKISLNKTRVIEYLQVGDTMKKHYLDQKTVVDFLDLKEGSMKTYKGSSLVDVDPFWGDVITALSMKYGHDHQRRCYNSHPYHILGMQQTEHRVHTVSSDNSLGVNFLFGNTTPLDHYGAELVKLTGATVVCEDETLFPDEGYCLNVIGDMILQCMFPKEITDYFTFVFANTSSVDEFNAGLFSQICRMKGEFVLRISRDAERAEQFREKIMKGMKDSPKTEDG